MVAEVRVAVEGGDYGSVSGVVRDALRLLVQEGIDNGPGLDAGAGFTRLRALLGQPPAE
jgi:Arc/MetJ-type ribon-helix-helix transcriptional regulator